MPSDVDIVNMALTLLGEQRIISLTQNTKAAKSANAIYEMQRDNELRTHIWNFATKRQLLPASTFVPAYGFGTAYQLPDDYIRLIQVGDFFPGALRQIGIVAESQIDYRIEGNMILTNGLGPLPSGVPASGPTPLKLRYTARITDPTQFDDSFVNAFSCRMAMRLCEDLTQDIGKRKMAVQEYQEAITTALRANAIELPPEMLPDNSWILSRLPG